MKDYTRLVFEALHAAGDPDAGQRARIFEDCRAQVAAGIAEPGARTKALEALERAIRRHEVQALFEESLKSRKPPAHPD